MGQSCTNMSYGISAAVFCVVSFSLLVTGCTQNSTSLSPIECAILEATLPEKDGSNGEDSLKIYVSDQVSADRNTRSASQVIGGKFENWDHAPNEPECQNLYTEKCFVKISETRLRSEEWPRKITPKTESRLSDCGPQNFDPEITDKDRQTLVGKMGPYAVEGVMLLTINQVILSRDKSMAIVTMEYTCGGLCGEGYSLLFDKQNGEWQNIGKQPHWIS